MKADVNGTQIELEPNSRPYLLKRIVADGFDTVLITCHHSGTADVKLVPKVRKWTANGIRCFMAPVPRNSNIYESRAMLEAAGCRSLPGVPVEGAWAEALIT